MTPETHFAENDGVSIAYQVFGDGPQDLIYIPGWLSNLDFFWAAGSLGIAEVESDHGMAEHINRFQG
jgi:pimeloyl-ACP methyl ester carboxylesterase